MLATPILLDQKVSTASKTSSNFCHMQAKTVVFVEVNVKIMPQTKCGVAATSRHCRWQV
jgi:hypothetical protein